MGTKRMVISQVAGQDTREMPCVHHDHMVQAFPTDTPNSDVPATWSESAPGHLERWRADLACPAGTTGTSDRGTACAAKQSPSVAAQRLGRLASWATTERGTPRTSDPMSGAADDTGSVYRRRPDAAARGFPDAR